jgi:phage tail-like protein
MPAATSRNEAYANCRFYVQVDSIPQGVFTELGGLTLEMEVVQVREGGFVTRKHPGQLKDLGNITLKRGITKSNDMFKWFKKVAIDGNMDYKNVTIQMFAADGTEIFRLDLKDAFPVKWTAAQMAATGNTPAVETLEIAHNGFVIR